MKILITTGLSGTNIGGPFQYAPQLEKEFKAMGYEVKVVSYGKMERVLPAGLRHLYFFLRIFPVCLWADRILTLDTFSVGVPTVLAAKICGKKSVVRVGGDFLWSAYVNRTSKAILLSEFYREIPKLNLKEKLILSLTKGMIKKVDFLAFNTEWQRKIWSNFYDIPADKSGVVRNFIPEKATGNISPIKNFLWACRAIPEKNLKFLKKIGLRMSDKHSEFRLDIVTGESHNKIIERIKECYTVVSLAFSDFCPNFILEGISFNKPFIMSKETGLNELYPCGGMFVNPLGEAEFDR